MWALPAALLRPVALSLRAGAGALPLRPDLGARWAAEAGADLREEEAEEAEEAAAAAADREAEVEVAVAAAAEAEARARREEAEAAVKEGVRESLASLERDRAAWEREQGRLDSAREEERRSLACTERL